MVPTTSIMDKLDLKTAKNEALIEKEQLEANQTIIFRSRGGSRSFNIRNGIKYKKNSCNNKD